MVTPTSLLLLEDNEVDAELLIKMLGVPDDQVWQIIHTQRLAETLHQLRATRFEIALINLSLHSTDSRDAISQIATVAPDLPIVALSQDDDRALALQAMAQGAQDVLAKRSLTVEILSRSIRYAMERGRTLRQLQAEVQERQRSEQILRLLVEGTAAVTGPAFFQSLVRSLAESLQVRYALVSGCIDSPPTRVCTYAFWQNDGFGENEEYDLYGTPCEQVFNGQGCQYYAQGIQALFPKDKGAGGNSSRKLCRHSPL